MELWIRSQDKLALVKIDKLEYFENNSILGTSSSLYRYNLGQYKTKERALQVLDEIQNAMLLNGLSNEESNVSNLEIKSWFATNSKTCLGIYQMPKE